MSPDNQPKLLARPKRVVAFVLEDFVQPKNAQHPVVHVTSSPSSEDSFPRKKSSLSRHVAGVLDIGTSNVFHTSRESLKQAILETRKDLSRLGFSVYTAGPRRIYVIEYNSGFKPQPGRTWLYVGETSQPVEQRIEQHFRGEKAARDWQNLWRRRPDLEPSMEYWSVEDSTEAETAHGLRMNSAGYLVRGPQGFSRKTGLPTEQSSS